MKLRKVGKRIKKKVLANWLHMLYYVLIFYVTFRTVEACNFGKIAIGYGIVSLILLIVIKRYSDKKYFRYSMSLVHFSLFLALIYYYNMNPVVLRGVAFNSLIIYAYLFDNPFVPFVLLGVLWIRFISYLDYTPYHLVRPLFFGSTFQTVGYVSAFTFFRILNKEKEKYKKLSITDSLTGTYTLNHIIELGNDLLDGSKDITLVIIDLNNFKQLNDNFGHMAGNVILKDIATLLKVKTEKYGGIIGRIGGDEFVVLLQDENHVSIKSFVDSLYESIHGRSFEVDPDLDSIKLSFAFGVARSRDEGIERDMEKMMYLADVQMYYNKYQTKNNAISFQSTRFFLPDQVLQYLNVLAEKDMYTYVHSEHVAKLAADLAHRIGLPMEKVAEIYIAGWIHDIGKVLIPNSILRKSGPLEDDEYKLIREHIDIGINIIRRLEISETIENGIRFHHENFDSSGYPSGRGGESIPIEGRIIKIIDAYSAMTIKRVYRNSLNKEAALEEIEKNMGTQFDPYLVDEFKNMVCGDAKKSVIDSVNQWIEKMQYRLRLSASYEYEN